MKSLAIRTWLPLAAGITLMSGLVYATVQQSYRQGANDPQIQMAEDAANANAKQTAPTVIDYAYLVDPSVSLSTFQITFDNDGKVLSSGATLGGKTPVPPAGVFDYAKNHLDDRFSWQPEAGVRIAAVLKHYSGSQNGYVLVGRSLREVELREDRLQIMVLLGWLAALGATLVLSTRKK